MARERKSPQQKKQLASTKDHFTFGRQSSRKFPTTWKRKKAHINREYRRKSQELLTQAKPGVAADDVELLTDDLTAARFQKSVIRKRLHKEGTVSVGEKVRRKLEIREERAGRKVRENQQRDQAALSAISTLGSLRDEKLAAVVRRADLLQRGRAPQFNDPIDHALRFTYLVSSGSAPEIDALRRNQELAKALRIWVEKAKRVLSRDDGASKTKRDQKQTARKLEKLTALSSRLRA